MANFSFHISELLFNFRAPSGRMRHNVQSSNRALHVSAARRESASARFYFFALLNRLSTQVVSACLLVMHPDLLSAPAGSRGGGLKPQSG